MDYINPERPTLECLSRLLPALDPARHGYAIDVGAGTGEYYWLSFTNWQFKTVCIEAYPTIQLAETLNTYNVPLISAALNDNNHPARLYLGRGGDPNLCGLDPTAWGADTSVSTIVSSITYQGVLRQRGIDKVTCLKLDIEGTEHRVIKALSSVPADVLPSVLCFEYGGGCSRAHGGWAWSVNGLARLDGILADLHAMGYTQIAAFDAAQPPVVVPLAYPYRETLNALFSDAAEWGNCIAVRGDVDLMEYV